MTALALLLTLTLSLLAAPLAAQAQPPSHVPRVGVLVELGESPTCSDLITSAALLDYIADFDLH